MKLAAPKRQLCTSQLLCYHKSTHSRGCHICFSHSHILYEHSHAKDDPLEMSLHDSVISGFCGTGLEVHVCWQTSGSLQNQEFWEFQKKAPLPNSATVVQAFNMSRNTAFSPFPVCREQSREQRLSCAPPLLPLYPRRRLQRPDRAMGTHHKHSVHSRNADCAQKSGISCTGRETSFNQWCKKFPPQLLPSLVKWRIFQDSSPLYALIAWPRYTISVQGSVQWSGSADIYDIFSVQWSGSADIYDIFSFRTQSSNEFSL